jgi:hypothetical protein
MVPPLAAEMALAKIFLVSAKPSQVQSALVTVKILAASLAGQILAFVNPDRLAVILLAQIVQQAHPATGQLIVSQTPRQQAAGKL